MQKISKGGRHRGVPLGGRHRGLPLGPLLPTAPTKDHSPVTDVSATLVETMTLRVPSWGGRKTRTCTSRQRRCSSGWRMDKILSVRTSGRQARCSGHVMVIDTLAHTCSSGGSEACSGSARSGPQDPPGRAEISALMRWMAFSISACPVRNTRMSPEGGAGDGAGG